MTNWISRRSRTEYRSTNIMGLCHSKPHRRDQLTDLDHHHHGDLFSAKDEANNMTRYHHHDGASPPTTTTTADVRPPTQLSSESINSVQCHSTLSNMILAGDNGGQLMMYDWIDEKKTVWKGHEKGINQVRCSADGQFAFTCSRDLSIHQYAISTSPQPFPEAGTTSPHQCFQNGHELTIAALAVNAGGTKVTSGGRDTRLCQWDVPTCTKTCQVSLSRNIITCIEWMGERSAESSSSNSQLIVQGSEDLCLRMWDLRAFTRPVQSFEGFTYFPLDVAVSRDDFTFFSASKGFNGVGCEGRLWDRRMSSNKSCVYQFHAHQQDATSCTFLNDEYAATVSKDQTICIWNVKNGTKVVQSSPQLDQGMFTCVNSVPDFQAQRPSSSSRRDDEHLTASERFQFATSSFSGQIQIYEYHPSTKEIIPVL